MKVLRADDHLVGVVAEIVVLAEHADFGRLVLHAAQLERFQAKHALGLDPGVKTGSRQENASNQESRAPFRFYRNGKGSRVCAFARPPG